MMNRNLRESLVNGGRRNSINNNYTAASHGRSSFPRDSDENLDLFSKSRRSLSHESSDASVRVGRILSSNGSGATKVKGGIDDLLSSTDGGKHDYDWLLTPPGTPLFSDGSESQSTSLAPRSNSKVRSVSTTKASRLSVSHSETNHSSRPARSNSVTRPSLSSSYNNYSSNRGGSSILNTSSASVSSYIRPSSPISRSLSSARPSTPSSRSTPSRPSTPSRVRPSPTTPYTDRSRPSQSSRPSTPSRVRPSPTTPTTDRSRPSQSSRPSTPTSRPQIPPNLNSTTIRSNSRPSTPTRRNSAPSLSTPASPSLSTGRIVSNGRTAAPSSRPSSPSPRVRTPQQPVVPPDFPHDTPPNLRTSLPDRPISAGRSRPGASVTTKTNQDTTSSINTPRRHSSPIVPRGRVTEPPGRTRVRSNEHSSDIQESRRISHLPDSAMRRPVKSSTATADATGFGRNISKKSLDMAIRHMDLKNGTGSIRSLSGTTLFPQSVRPAIAKTQSLHSLSTSDSFNSNGSAGSMKNGDYTENGNGIMRPAENGRDFHDGRYSAKLSEVDIYESSRYDAMLLKEDLNNTSWLHSIDDKSDQGSIFDHGFESLPEPFGLL